MRDGDGLDQQNKGGGRDKWLDSRDTCLRQSQQSLLLDVMCDMTDREELGMMEWYCLLTY